MQKIKEMMTSFWKDEEGLGIVESLLILAVVIAVALIFKKEITAMVNNIFAKENEKIKGIIE